MPLNIQIIQRIQDSLGKTGLIERKRERQPTPMRGKPEGKAHCR